MAYARKNILPPLSEWDIKKYMYGLKEYSLNIDDFKFFITFTERFNKSTIKEFSNKSKKSIKYNVSVSYKGGHYLLGFNNTLKQAKDRVEEDLYNMRIISRHRTQKELKDWLRYHSTALKEMKKFMSK
jgi:hypothetical protein